MLRDSKQADGSTNEKGRPSPVDTDNINNALLSV